MAETPDGGTRQKQHKALIQHLRDQAYFFYGKCQLRVDVGYVSVYDKNIPEHNRIFHNKKIAS